MITVAFMVAVAGSEALLCRRPGQRQRRVGEARPLAAQQQRTADGALEKRQQSPCPCPPAAAQRIVHQGISKHRWAPLCLTVPAVHETARRQPGSAQRPAAIGALVLVLADADTRG